MRRAPTNRMIGADRLQQRAPAPAPPAGLATGYAISAADFETWLARRGGSPDIIYAQGYSLPRGHIAVLLADQAQAAGLVDLVTRVAMSASTAAATDRWFHFIAQRRSRAGAGGAADGATSDAADRVFAHIKRLALVGAPGPTNDEIARATGLKDADAARYQLGKLVSAGRVEIEDNGPRQRRIFSILGGAPGYRAVVARTTGGAV